MPISMGEEAQTAELAAEARKDLNRLHPLSPHSGSHSLCTCAEADVGSGAPPRNYYRRSAVVPRDRDGCCDYGRGEEILQNDRPGRVPYQVPCSPKVINLHLGEEHVQRDRVCKRGFTTLAAPKDGLQTPRGRLCPYETERPGYHVAGETASQKSTMRPKIQPYALWSSTNRPLCRPA